MNHKRKRKQRIYTFFIVSLGITVFTAIFLVFFVVANWPAVKNELAFAIQPAPAPTAQIIASNPTQPTPTPVPIYEPAHLMIEKLNLDVPILWDIPAEQTLDALNKGIAHLEGSAKVGQIGNIFLTGHSSDFVWKKNPYAAVFSLLPKLAVGDTITIREHGKEYVYALAEAKIVNPNQVEVTRTTTTPVLTLMTCYPVGTTKQRYIVHARLISSPDAPQAVGQTSTGTLPPIRFR